MWHHRRGCVGGKLKIDGVNATDCVRSCYPTFAVFNVLGLMGIIVI
jgi:hypothetical protein